MDIQSRKIAFIQEFLKIQNEELISRLETLIKNKNKDDECKPFTIEEFEARIEESLKDSLNNRVTESDDLLTEMKQWQ